MLQDKHYDDKLETVYNIQWTFRDGAMIIDKEVLHFKHGCT